MQAVNTYWIVDVLAWNGMDLGDCTAECRLVFWMQSKMAELAPVPGTEHGLSPLPFAPCTPGESSFGHWQCTHLLGCSLGNCTVAYSTNHAAAHVALPLKGRSDRHSMCCCTVAVVSLNPHLAIEVHNHVLTAYDAAEALQGAHSAQLPFQRDGLLFLHKDALYQVCLQLA